MKWKIMYSFDTEKLQIENVYKIWNNSGDNSFFRDDVILQNSS